MDVLEGRRPDDAIDRRLLIGPECLVGMHETPAEQPFESV